MRQKRNVYFIHPMVSDGGEDVVEELLELLVKESRSVNG